MRAQESSGIGGRALGPGGTPGEPPGAPVGGRGGPDHTAYELPQRWDQRPCMACEIAMISFQSEGTWFFTSMT